jgi:hypothetical protein
LFAGPFRTREGRVLRIAMLVLVAAISTAQAQTELGTTVIIPQRGGLSCGKWTNTPKHSPEHEIYQKWIFGYLSGVNMEHTKHMGSDFLRDRDTDGLTAWIDNYCRRNPLHPITQAVVELINELRSGR